MKCPVCGSEQPLGMAYCDQCGSPLSDDVTAPTINAQAAASPPSVAPTPPHDAAATSVPPPPRQDVVPPDDHVGLAAAGATSSAGTPDDATNGTGPAAAPASTATLTLKFPTGAQFVPSTEVINIGRSDAAQDWHPELDVIPYGGGVPEMGVSRHHARLVHQDGKYLLMDVGSTNGTYVNGSALEYNKAAELKDGDTVAFGAFSTQVVLQ